MPTYSPQALQKIKNAGKGVNFLSVFSTRMAAKIALRLFMTPIQKKMTPVQIDFLKSAKQSDIVLQNHKIRCYEWLPEDKVNGKSVLFVHGWSSNAARWARMITIFQKKGYHVRAIDAPAHGASSGKRLNISLYGSVLRDYIAVRDAPDLIVGHSIGAAAAVFALTYFEAQRPEQLVLLAGFADSERVMKDFTELFGFTETVEDAMDAEIEKQYGMPMAAFRMDKFIADLGDVKGLVVHDENDDIAPYAEGQALAANWPNAQFFTTKTHGHSLYGAKVLDAVLDFVG